MKLFTIHPGASTSTHDVFTGLTRALESQGHTLVKYKLSARIAQSASWLMHSWRQARKAGLDISKPNQADILYHAHGDALLKALHHDCEWVLLFSAMFTPLYVIRLFKKAGLKIALVLTESPYNDEEQAQIIREVDIAWTNERSSVERLRHSNPNVYYLPHGYDEQIHSFRHPVEESILSHDVVFVGSGFHERVEILRDTDWTDIDFGLYGFWQLGSRHRLKQYLRSGAIPNSVTAGLYRNAKIGLNIFRRSVAFDKRSPRVEGAESISPRIYELAACGCFFVSDPRDELDEIFGGAVPTFETADELGEVVRKYLSNDVERARIAGLLREAVVGHTWANRAERLMNDLGAHVQQRSESEVIQT